MNGRSVRLTDGTVVLALNRDANAPKIDCLLLKVGLSFVFAIVIQRLRKHCSVLGSRVQS
jgi:hypothetical protein